MHLRCLFFSKHVAIYALLVCKIYGRKIWSCKFFDKSQVRVHSSLVSNLTNVRAKIRHSNPEEKQTNISPHYSPFYIGSYQRGEADALSILSAEPSVFLHNPSAHLLQIS